MSDWLNKRIVFLGTPDFAVPSLAALLACGAGVVGVVSQPDRPQGRRQVIVPTPVKQTAMEADIPVFQPERINQPEAYQQIAAWRPDLIVTAAYGQIIGKRLLDLPPHGCLNVHASLLPCYRGASPIQAAIMSGDCQTGVTIMLMDEGCDTGAILRQTVWPIEAGTTAGDLSDRLAELGAETLIEILPAYFAGEIVPQAQDVLRASYSPRLTRETGRLDWSLPADQLACLVRGTYPWPGAFATFGGKRLKIFRAEADVQTGPIVRPGEIIGCDGALSVQCGEGILRLLELQPAGGKRMTSDMCAHNFRVGACFD